MQVKVLSNFVLVSLNTQDHPANPLSPVIIQGRALSVRKTNLNACNANVLRFVCHYPKARDASFPLSRSVYIFFFSHTIPSLMAPRPFRT